MNPKTDVRIEETLPTSCCDEHCQQSIPSPQPAITHKPDQVSRAVFRIDKMDCPTEERLIRKRLQHLAGIETLSFNLLQRELTVMHRLASITPLVDALNDVDMVPAVRFDSLAGSRAAAREQIESSVRPAGLGGEWVRIAVAGAAAIGAEATAWISGLEQWWLVIALAVFAILIGGIDTLKKGWNAIAQRSLNMDFLMSLAVIGAAAIGQWPEAAVVIVLFALAEMLESRSLDRARHAITGLMAMAPERARVLQGDGEWADVPANGVAVGSLVRVGPGERIPLDGTVASGATTVNQAPITGESIPVTKEAGDSVFAGTINERGSIDYRVSATQDQSTLARIIHAVETAQGQRAPTQRFVDTFARYYIPIVVAIAVLVAIVPPLFLSVPLVPWLYKALVLLVIACPCALVISTPVSVVSGLAAAARHGILIKGGLYLEQGRKLKALAIDKTGTITTGKPKVTDIERIGEIDVQEALRLAASLAERSDHPVASAVVEHWRRQPAAAQLFSVRNVEALTGRGVRGSISGKAIVLGNHRLIEELGLCTPALEAILDRFEGEGKTVVVLAIDNAPQLVIAVADTVRSASRAAVADLQSLGVHVVMLTGDNAHTAAAVAHSVGIQDARGSLLPEDKLTAIDELERGYGTVGMVGDGINDAPALARADIGFAMGAAGSDTALETADVALMDDDLRKIPDFMRISRRVHAVLVQNVAVALGIKAVFFGLALVGMATLWMAVFADMGASLIVVFNGLRLIRAYRVPVLRGQAAVASPAQGI